MRILMLNNEFPPLGGGTATVNEELLRRFAGKETFEIDLITSGAQQQECLSFAPKIQIYKVPVASRCIHHASEQELLRYAWRALALARQLHRQNRYDLCFAWSTVPAGAVALALKTFSGLPYMVRVCGPDLPGFEDRYRRLYPFLKAPIFLVLKNARRVIGKCQEEIELIRKTCRTARVETIPNGSNVTGIEPAPLDGSENELRILCVGRLIQRKGQPLLFEAVAGLKKQGIDPILTLVGTGDEEPQYRQQVQALGIEKNVRFDGYVPRAKMPQIYSSAHVFVLPSYNEGMSVATLEALAAGLPLIVTDCGGARELVEQGANGFLIDRGDAQSLLARLLELARDPALLRGFGARSRRKAAAMTWEQAAAAYEGMLLQGV